MTSNFKKSDKVCRFGSTGDKWGFSPPPEGALAAEICGALGG